MLLALLLDQNNEATRFARPAFLNENNELEPLMLRADDVFDTSGISAEEHMRNTTDAHGRRIATPDEIDEIVIFKDVPEVKARRFDTFWMNCSGAEADLAPMRKFAAFWEAAQSRKFNLAEET